ncbi:hypothetical protein D3C85_1480040 [compost metagenome]
MLGGSTSYFFSLLSEMHLSVTLTTVSAFSIKSTITILAFCLLALNVSVRMGWSGLKSSGPLPLRAAALNTQYLS